MWAIGTSIDLMRVLGRFIQLYYILNKDLKRFVVLEAILVVVGITIHGN